MNNPYGGQPPRPPFGQQRPPYGPAGRQQNNSTRNTWIALGAVAIVILCCCSGLGFNSAGDKASPARQQESSAAPATTRPPDPRDMAIFTAEVESVDGSRITLAAYGREVTVSLAKVDTIGACSTEMRQFFDTRLATLLPMASQVTVVREKPGERYSDVFVHTGAAADISGPPAGPSLNEQLVAEGVASLEGARRDSDMSYDEQVAAVRAQSAPVAVPYVDAIAKADTMAWEGRIGAVADCRARLDREDQEKREKYGPDSEYGTDDDPEPTYPTYSGNGNGHGGGGGGGGGCRRSRFC